MPAPACRAQRKIYLLGNNATANFQCDLAKANRCRVLQAPWVPNGPTPFLAGKPRSDGKLSAHRCGSVCRARTRLGRTYFRLLRAPTSVSEGPKATASMALITMLCISSLLSIVRCPIPNFPTSTFSSSPWSAWSSRQVRRFHWQWEVIAPTRPARLVRKIKYRPDRQLRQGGTKEVQARHHIGQHAAHLKSGQPE